MKIPSSSSILLATLAVSSSSSALVPPPTDTHQDAPLSSASSASIASSSSGSLASLQTGFPQRELIQESFEQRGLSIQSLLDARLSSLLAILDILPLACQLAHTLTDNLPTPIPALVGVLCSPSPANSKGFPNHTKAHKELSVVSDALQQAVFASGVSVPLSTAPTVAPSSGVAADNGHVDAANSARFAPSASGSSPVSLIPSASSTAWRIQPTPANSPSLPVDDLQER
jgi:hypothetical protein